MNVARNKGDLVRLTADLCGYLTGIVNAGNSALFDRIERELPLRRHRWMSGEEFNGWIVPDQWSVETATIRKDGRLICDGAAHYLGVAHYSRSFVGRISREELLSHLFSNPELPDALMWHCSWLYRPWAANWGFCLPHRLVQTLAPGDYDVELRTTFTPGEMLLATHDKPGRSDRVVVFHTNTCHPKFANDGFAGTAVLIRLFQWLSTRETRYTYRLVMGPEHIGTVFYLRDQSSAEIDKYLGGVFAEMLGTPGGFRIASSLKGDSILDRAIHHAARRRARDTQFVPFGQTAVNDETVWEAPGWEVPFASVTRAADLAKPYREYHSELDNADLMDEDQLEQALDVFKDAIEILESDRRILRKFDGLIALSNPRHGLYYDHVDPAVTDESRRKTVAWAYLQDVVMRYFDGSMTVLDISDRHDLPFVDMLSYLKRYEEKGLVDLLEVEPTPRYVRSAVELGR